MAMFIQDFSDMYDKTKWDFEENDIPVYWIDKYPYRAKSIQNAYKLFNIRRKIDQLCKNLIDNKFEWKKSTSNNQYLNGVDIFLGIHNENLYDPYTLPDPFFEIANRGFPVSRYLLSEIPKGTIYKGINKPRMRYDEVGAPLVGKDGSGRALYRHIFLDLDQSDNGIKNLIIHELAHTMANHIRWKEDNHHDDFKWAENLIKKNWPN